MLDIGVGTGRTVPYVAPAAAAYIGVDFMPNMIDAARLLHPGVDLRVADARKLPFEDGQFTFVLFSFCGIDYVDPDERSGVLAEIHRVLVPGGMFAYSTHNLRSLDRVPLGFRPEGVHLGGSVVRSALQLARAAARTARAYRNFRRLESLQRVHEDVAFVIDGAHESSLLTCYVKQEHQREALRAAGFEVKSVVEPSGADAPIASRARDLYIAAERR